MAGKWRIPSFSDRTFSLEELAATVAAGDVEIDAVVQDSSWDEGVCIRDIPGISHYLQKAEHSTKQPADVDGASSTTASVTKVQRRPANRGTESNHRISMQIRPNYKLIAMALVAGLSLVFLISFNSLEQSRFPLPSGEVGFHLLFIGRVTSAVYYRVCWIFALLTIALLVYGCLPTFAKQSGHRQ